MRRNETVERRDSYFDLSSKRETRNFGGMRPGCWINAIPAGGLLLVPDATSGCACGYLNRAWIALEPSPSHATANGDLQTSEY